MNSATETNPFPVIVMAGPTASGKSSAAMDVADEFNGVIINADSMQVYEGLGIVTARPSSEDEAKVPHRLYGVMPPGKNCSVARWRDMAVQEIYDARSSGLLPIVTGGTGMYLRALMHGLAEIPDVPATVRNAVQEQMEQSGGQVMLDQLADIDPETAVRLEPGDTQRLIRAMEVYEGTGKTLSFWLSAGNSHALPEANFLPIILMPPREVLYERINQRFRTMIEEGALEEVQAILKRNPDPSLSAMKAVGVRELAGYLRDEFTLELAITRAQQASRNYAKRQMTWFRNQIPEGKTFFAQYSESLRAEIFSFIRQFLLTNRF